MSFIIPLLQGIGAAVTGGSATGAAAGVIGAGAVVGGGLSIASSVRSLISKPPSASTPKSQPLPPTPKIEDATKKAQAEVERRRRISLLTGGQTNVTGGAGAVVPEVNIGRKSLVGA